MPDKFQDKFEKLLADLVKLNPDWEITYPKTPHITVYYLDKQSQYVLPAIASIVKTKISILKNLILTVNGFSCFKKGDSRESIIFLDIIFKNELVAFNQYLAANLNQYYASDNNLPFHPHITVARVDDLLSVDNFENSVLKLEQKIGEINWEFPVSEIVIYGVDSTIQPQDQEKLITIPI